MTVIWRDLEWFDFDGWRSHLAELQALPPSDIRDRQIASVERHLAEIAPFEKTETPPGDPAV